MKNIYLFSTRLYVFLTEFPLMLLLSVAIKFNEKAENLLKLYPLIVLTTGIMLFILIYFIRGIKINADEIRTVGVFASRDYVLIKPDTRIVLTDKGKRRLKLEVYGRNDHSATYNWQRNDIPDEINLFRATAIGGAGSITSLLRFYGFDKTAADNAIESESFEAESPLAKLRVRTGEETKEYELALIIPTDDEV